MASLILFTGAGDFVVHPDLFEKNVEVSMGRDTRHPIHLQEALVSNWQGTFKRTAEGTEYTDIGSTNGTYVERSGMKAVHLKKGSLHLQDGDLLRIGSKVYPERQVALLHFEDDGAKGWSRYVLEEGITTFGNRPGSTVQIRAKNNIPIQFEIHKNQDGTTIHFDSYTDLTINGKPVSTGESLREKDCIQILDGGNVVSSFFHLDGCLCYQAPWPGRFLVLESVSKRVKSGLRKKKHILEDVNLEIGEGQFVAIVGGSGAGKTTVMNAMAGFDTKISGQVSFGGVNLQKAFEQVKTAIGYVPQQDILYDNISLQDMLESSAKVRMPASTSAKERETRIQEVLESVQMEEHRHTWIGKLSGGQKKRVSIAVELLSDPKLFFLDEPTSGLDSGTEKGVMRLLNRLAKEERRTIIMVTHTVENLNLCDKVLVMAKGGRIAFYGTSGEAKEAFETASLCDIYPLAEAHPERYVLAWKQRGQKMACHPSQKPWLVKEEKASTKRQALHLFGRYVKLMLNSPLQTGFLLLQPVAIALLLGVVANKETFEFYDSTKSILFSLTCAAIWTGLFDTIQEICKERAIVRRESMGRMKLRAYMAAKAGLFLLLGLVQSILLAFSFFAVVESGMKELMGFGAMTETILVLFVAVAASQAMGFAISAACKKGEKAMVYAPVLLIVQLLFSGALFKLEGLKHAVSAFTVSRWGMESLGALADLNSLPAELSATYPAMDLQREAEAMFEAAAGHYVTNLAMMVLIAGASVLLALLFLKRTRQDAR